MSDTAECTGHDDGEHAWTQQGVWQLSEYGDPKLVFFCFSCGAWTTYPLATDAHIHHTETEVMPFDC